MSNQVKTNQSNINMLVRDKAIDKIMKKGAGAEYIKLEGKDKINALNSLLNKHVKAYVEAYDEMLTVGADKADAVKHLIEVEEVIKAISTEQNCGWAVFYDASKMQMYVVGIEESTRRYQHNPTLKNLTYVECALFEEVKALKMDYCKFQAQRVNRRKREGGYKEGYLLQSINYNNEQGINKK